MHPAAFAPSQVLVAAFDGRVIAYDRASGRTAWQFVASGPALLPHQPRPTHVVVDEERVFVVTAQLRDGGALQRKGVYALLTALELRTGRPLWAQALDMNQAPTAFSATVLVDAGQVILFHGGGAMACWAATGQILWQRTSEHGDGGRFVAALELAVVGKIARPS